MSGGNILHHRHDHRRRRPPARVRPARCASPACPTAIKDVEIWLPHNETTELVALRTDAPGRAAAPSGRRVWLHHGSSISHGSNAAEPHGHLAGAWRPRAAGVELVNLGFGGSALLDPFTARTMRDTPADLISVKIGINVVNNDLMRLRAFGPAVHGFLDTIRDGHPTRPLLVVSPLLCPIHEDTPGPSAPDLERSRGAAAVPRHGRPGGRGRREADAAASSARSWPASWPQRAADDPNLHYLDGRDLYGEADAAELPLPDQLHPDAATHRRIGERFARSAFAPDGAFGC